MPTEHNVQERRRYPHRHRRGPDRRGQERRTPPAPAAAPERSGVDVDQLMRDIRARIAQRHGIDLSTDQIRDLAARRLEALFDPRDLPPGLLDTLRRDAATPAATPECAALPPAFDENALYAGSGLAGGLRRLLRPLLALFIDPAALAATLRRQTELTGEIAAREAERDRRQAEWNALHYTLLQRLVTEVARVSIDMQSLSLRVESLAAKVDFNERRVRSIEGTPSGTGARPPRAAEPAVAIGPVAVDDGGAPAPAVEGAADGPRRKRRRRRGRRVALPGGDRTAADVTAEGEDESGTDAPDDTEAATAAEDPAADLVQDASTPAERQEPIEEVPSPAGTPAAASNGEGDVPSSDVGEARNTTSREQ